MTNIEFPPNASPGDMFRALAAHYDANPGLPTPEVIEVISHGYGKTDRSADYRALLKQPGAVDNQSGSTVWAKLTLTAPGQWPAVELTAFGIDKVR